MAISSFPPFRSRSALKAVPQAAPAFRSRARIQRHAADWPAGTVAILVTVAEAPHAILAPQRSVRGQTALRAWPIAAVRLPGSGRPSGGRRPPEHDIAPTVRGSARVLHAPLSDGVTGVEVTVEEVDQHLRPTSPSRPARAGTGPPRSPSARSGDRAAWPGWPASRRRPGGRVEGGRPTAGPGSRARGRRMTAASRRRTVSPPPRRGVITTSINHPHRGRRIPSLAAVASATGPTIGRRSAMARRASSVRPTAPRWGWPATGTEVGGHDGVTGASRCTAAMAPTGSSTVTSSRPK